jgi:hypothetical protein
MLFRAVSVPAKIPNGTSRTYARKKTVKAKHLVAHCKALVSLYRTGLTDRNVGHVSEYTRIIHTHTHTDLHSTL